MQVSKFPACKPMPRYSGLPGSSLKYLCSLKMENSCYIFIVSPSPTKKSLYFKGITPISACVSRNGACLKSV